MAKLSYNGFVSKWHDRFLPNTVFKIEEADFQEFALDIADTFGVSVANVPEYVAGTTYAVGYLVRYTPANAQEAFYYALNPGQLTAPGSGNTTDWKVVPGPVLPTELSQSISLLQAQGLDQTSVKAGRLYLIDFGPDANGYTQTIAVRGVSNDCFDVVGTLEVGGQRWGVTNVDVQAGTWVLAGTDAYTKAQTDVLLAAKQGAVTKLERVGISSSSPVATLTSASFSKYTRIDNDGNATVNLPTPAVTDVGKSIVLWHYGRAANLTLLVQAKYTNGVKPVDATATPVVGALLFNYVAALQVVLMDRGTPYNDTVPAYAITSLSLLDASVLATKAYVDDAINAIPGGTSYTDAQAADAAAAALLGSVQQGITITQDPGTGQLKFDTGGVGRLYFTIAAAGSGNLATAAFPIFPGDVGFYAWVGDSNVSQVDLKTDSGYVLFSGPIADLRANGCTIVSGTTYNITLTPINTTQAVYLYLAK